MINRIHVVKRKGLSLVEILIAMVMTLVVLGAMMAAFSYGSAEMQKGRASIELNNRLISAEEQLRRDLDRITVELKPHQGLPALPKGYVEVVDGPQTDYIATNDPATGATFPHGANELVYGDRDDYFACTIKSDGKPFRGRLGNAIVESHLAEVAWFTVFNPATLANQTAAGVNADVLLVRRQLLILPTAAIPAGVTYDAFLRNNDISIRNEGGTLVANTLTDLAIRGNRFSHSNQAATQPQNSLLEILQLGDRYNDDHIVASSIASFDIQVFTPSASHLVFSNALGTDILDVAEPGDIGQIKGGTTGTLFSIAGGYVDLGKATGKFGAASHYRFGYDRALPPPHLILPRTAAGSAILPALAYDVYDTGTSQYNRDVAGDTGSNGVDDNSDGQIDDVGEPVDPRTGLPDGVDNDGDGILDEASERDAVAPYNAPIRGLKFTMRVIEPNTKQVRQLSVKKSFVE